MMMMTHLIRLAEIDDYEGVSRLVTQIHQLHVNERPDIYAPYDNPMGIDYYRKILREERTAVIVAVNPAGGRIDAYTVIRIDEAAFRPIYQQRKYIFVDDFCVEESHRGQGIGKVLFRFLIEYAKEISATNIELGVAEFNTGALQFYESMGMKTRSRKMEYIIE
jgi:ribosomal protein S18 acetylase RimI-like enzyme